VCIHPTKSHEKEKDLDLEGGKRLKRATPVARPNGSRLSHEELAPRLKRSIKIPQRSLQ
jgi:hypothetical protein